jgi:hypothetical protein
MRMGNQAIVQGKVTKDGVPVPVGYGRLLSAGATSSRRCRSARTAGSGSAQRPARLANSRQRANCRLGLVELPSRLRNLFYLSAI